jgi:carboxyl-terminal processing protease
MLRPPRSRRIATLLAAVSVALGLTAPVYGQKDSPPDAAGTEAVRFAKVYGLIERNFMDRTNPDRLIFDGGIRGMLDALDPFSAFFDPDQFQMLQQQTRGEALGFGSILYVEPGKVLVLETAQGSPSWRGGLGPGDQIVEINGQRVDSLDFESLIRLLRSSRSKPVRLGVIHPGRDVAQDYELRPAQVALPTVDKTYKFEQQNIGYVHIAGFEARTARETADAINRLGGAKLSGLLLDLRDNHGGVLATAVAVASLFLKPDDVVLSVRGRSSPPKSYRALPVPFHYDFPIVALVNGETASAAEVLAAALQDHDRAVIAGEPTFGKGLVQEVVPLSEQTGLALTTALYFTPSGRSVQRPLPGTALAQAIHAVDAQGGFHTDDGRPLSSGGGVQPDVPVPPRTLDPWETFLDRRGYFTDFASDYLTFHPHVTRAFEPGADALAEFKNFLGRKSVRTPQEYWQSDQDYLKLRIKMEVFNLAFGLKAGDEVGTRADLQVQKALELFPRIPDLLKASSSQVAQARSKKAAGKSR